VAMANAVGGFMSDDDDSAYKFNGMKSINLHSK